MEFCDTYVKERHGRRGTKGHDLFCRTHNMWVYAEADSELLNVTHEKVRWAD